MTVVLAGLLLLLVLVCAAGARSLRRELAARRRDASLQMLLATFAPAIALAETDPRQLLIWFPAAETARRLFADAFVELDAASGGHFPFTPAHVHTAHARWTTEWLAWEAKHESEYRLRAAAAEAEASRVTGEDAAIARARLGAIDREKLERYQQRYEEYIRTAKALMALAPREEPPAPLTR